MNRYRVTRLSDGAQVYEYAVDGGPVEWPGMEFATHDHALLDEPPAPPPEPFYGGRRTLSRLEFLRLFTPGERIAIRSAAAHSAALADFMHMLDLADTVQLDSADTQAGVALLEQSGLIAAGRAQEVLRG